MRNKQQKQPDFLKGMGDGAGAGYKNPAIDQRMAEIRRNNANTAYGYGSEYAKPGDVYLMIGILRGFRVRVKIGLSGNHKRRLQEIRDDHGKFIVTVFVISTSNMIRLEKAAHARFKAYNEHEAYGTGRTEFFKVNPVRLIKMIWFLFMKEKSLQCFDRIESMKNIFQFGRKRV